MSSSLVQILIALAVGPAANTPTGAKSAGISVVVTDPVSGPQPAVVLTGAEATAWAFTASVNPGIGSATATAVDVNGAALAPPITQSFTEAGSPPTFFPPTGITVTPVVAAASPAPAAPAA
jgi:hypothetical protein